MLTGFEQKICEAIAVGMRAAADVLERAEVIGSVGSSEDDEDETPPPAPKGKRGRPAKAKPAEVEDDEESEDDEDETPPPAKRGRKAAKPAPVEDDEDEDAEDDEDEIDEDEDAEDDEPAVDAKTLAKIKKALDAYATHHKSKQKAVKVLLKFAPTAQQVKASQANDLLKALKV